MYIVIAIGSFCLLEKRPRKRELAACHAHTAHLPADHTLYYIVKQAACMHTHADFGNRNRVSCSYIAIKAQPDLVASY